MTSLKKILIRFIKKIISLSGYELRGIKPKVAHNDYNAIHKFLISEVLKCQEPVIFDVGANDGESIERFKKIFSKSKIYSFEPDDNAFQRLKKNYYNKENIEIFDFGISNRDGNQQFYSYDHDKISSLMQLDANSKLFKSRKIAKNSGEDFEKLKDIKILKLDSFVKDKNIPRINILKIDVQGYEPEVIEGAKYLIENNKIDIIEMEIILGYGYSKSISFYDIEKNFSKQEYKLAAINYDSNIISYSNYQIDVIYVSKMIFDKIKGMHYKNIEIEGVTRKTDRNNPYSY